MTTASVSNHGTLGPSGSFLKTVGTLLLITVFATIFGAFCGGFVIGDIELAFHSLNASLQWFWPILLGFGFTGFMFLFEGNRSETLMKTDAHILYLTAGVGIALMSVINLGIFAYSNNPALRNLHIFSGH